MKTKLLWLAVLLLQSMAASAYECASIGWHGGDANISVNISSNVSTGKNRSLGLEM